MSALSGTPTVAGRRLRAAERFEMRPVRHSGPPSVRLTRRGRLVVTLFLLLILTVASVFLAARSAATGEPGADTATRTVVVARGDTLWDIASGVADPGETREMVHRIETLNALPGPELVEGQELAVPLQ